MCSTHLVLRNHLLSGLAPAECERVYPYLKTVSLPAGKVLYESGDVISHVYYPTDCVVSLLYVLEDGGSTELSAVGNEGMIGVPLFMGGETTPSRAVVQCAGNAYRLPAQILKDAFDRNSELRMSLLRYTLALIAQMAQMAVCNRHHSVDQQLCRWLLLSLDRIERNVLAATQQTIANMLGVRREGVTDAALKLQKMDAIRYARGKITVLDRGKLEALSCECYSVVRRETDRLRAIPRNPRMHGGYPSGMRSPSYSSGPIGSYMQAVQP
jgi:CRP-like cAMP-binding protein